jgi:hypothetical protein
MTAPDIKIYFSPCVIGCETYLMVDGKRVFVGRYKTESKARQMAKEKKEKIERESVPMKTAVRCLQSRVWT